jgi:UDP-N-acetylmuramyl pentapeptide phosphotransferase/UDP-N-acetylglucosamine-1-phosphate transferase
MVIGGLIIIGAAFCASYLGIKLFRRLSANSRLIAIPNDRSSHTKPTPSGGGVVIVLSCLMAYLAISLLLPGTFSWGYVAGAVLIALISFLDDLRQVPFLLRLLVHVSAAVLLIVDLDTWHSISFLGREFHLGSWGYVLTVIWVVSMINVYNFMDGIDGLAGLQAVITSFGWLVLGYMLEIPALALFSGAIAAAAFGFLLHNWSPASVFMGDVGSAFFGFTFAALPILARTMTTKPTDLLPFAAVLFVWVFLFDATFCLLRRLFYRQNVFAAHRTHLYQRLVILGYSHRVVTLIYGLMACVSVGLTVAWVSSGGDDLAYLYWFPLMGVALWLFVVKLEREKKSTVAVVGN